MGGLPHPRRGGGGEVGGRRNACAVTVRSEELVPAIAEPIDSLRTPSKGPHLPSRVCSIDLWCRLVDS